MKCSAIIWLSLVTAEDAGQKTVNITRKERIMAEKYIPVKDIMTWLDEEVRRKNIGLERRITLCEVVRKVVHTPAADVRRNVHGYWKTSRSIDGSASLLCFCSQCGSVGKVTDKYCSQCGSVMDEV